MALAGTEADGRRTPREFDDDSRQWIEGLGAAGSHRDETIVRLHARLVGIARAEATRRAPRLNVYGPELEDIASQAAADALLAVTAKVGQFRGESKFTTWAYKFVMFEVSSKMSRHFWNKSSVPYDNEDWEQLPSRLGAGPEELVEGDELIAAVRHVVETELTDKQRLVFVALVLNGMPLDALVDQLGSSRSAIYKMMFDARRKLRASLVANGYLDDVRPRPELGGAS